MSKFEKITISVVLLVLITSFSIYGVWEEKMTFLSFLIPVLYLALAVWAGRQLCCRKARTEYRGLRTEDQGSKTANRGQKTEDRRQRTEGSLRPGGAYAPEGGGLIKIRTTGRQDKEKDGWTYSVLKTFCFQKIHWHICARHFL